MAITIRVPWKSPYDTNDQWNELCAWTIGTFGMPNFERYQWHARADYMEFIFEDERDALFFQLKSLGLRVENQQQSVEFISKWL